MCSHSSFLLMHADMLYTQFATPLLSQTMRNTMAKDLYFAVAYAK